MIQIASAPSALGNGQRSIFKAGGINSGKATDRLAPAPASSPQQPMTSTLHSPTSATLTAFAAGWRSLTFVSTHDPQGLPALLRPFNRRALISGRAKAPARSVVAVRPSGS
jgi:hypothetical protein